MEASVFIATSLDGFIARKNGDIDWLVDGNESGEDFGFKNFMDSVDALVMGRNTYEKVLSFAEWPYGDTPVIVLSSRSIEIPDRISCTVESMSSPPVKLLEQLSQRGWNHLYIDGGKTIQAFLDAGLIRWLIITRLPILIGTGIPLFGPLSRDLRLRHVGTKQFPNGFTQSEYEVLQGNA